MTKSKRFLQSYILGIIFLISLYLALFQFEVLKLPVNLMITNVVVNTGLALIGAVMLSKALTKSAEQFVMYFMATTTVQMLSIMIAAVVVVYSKVELPKIAVFHIMGLFLSILLIQTLLLVKNK